jgi:hypothetical protein
LYTQAALIAVIVLMILDSIIDTKTGMIDKNRQVVSLIITIVAFTLLFLGPGSFAFDLPL